MSGKTIPVFFTPPLHRGMSAILAGMCSSLRSISFFKPYGNSHTIHPFNNLLKGSG